MRNGLSKICRHLLVINMWGFCILGPLLFGFAILQLFGISLGGTSLHMAGKPVESTQDLYTFMAATASLGLLGFTFVWLHTIRPTLRSQKGAPIE